MKLNCTFFTLILFLIPLIVRTQDPPVCGNGVQEGLEECDDGNTVNDDYCRNDCILPICGDGITQTMALGEQCDDGNEDNSDNCTNVCQFAVCGDGFIQLGEECDDGDAEYTDACTVDCRNAYCGDGFVWLGVEQCDDSNGNDTDACTNACTFPPGCGDGITQTELGEECDDANGDNSDACTWACLNATCGDGYVQYNVEQCDDGNTNDTDDCKNDCTSPIPEGTCVMMWYPTTTDCHATFVYPSAGEPAECTLIHNADAFFNITNCNATMSEIQLFVSGTNCSTSLLIANISALNHGECTSFDAYSVSVNCTCADPPRCGDSITQLENGEQCDDGNQVNDDYCRNDCILPICGDGIIQTIALSEQCDDGNSNDFDACTNLCQLPRCGDAIVQSFNAEECDDGNQINDDLCSNACLNATCGDSITQVENGEECDDGNANDTDLCSNTCHTIIPPLTGQCIGAWYLSESSCIGAAFAFGADANVCTLITGTDASFNITSCNSLSSTIDIFSDGQCLLPITSLVVLNAGTCSDFQYGSISINCVCMDPEVVMPPQPEPGQTSSSSPPSSTADPVDSTSAFTPPSTVSDPAICGDNMYAPGVEECDDGNNVNGDGCSATCLCETSLLTVNQITAVFSLAFPHNSTRIYDVTVLLSNMGDTSISSVEFIHQSGPGDTLDNSFFSFLDQPVLLGGSRTIAFQLVSETECTELFDFPSVFDTVFTYQQSQAATIQCNGVASVSSDVLTVELPKICGDRCTSDSMMEECDNPGDMCCQNCTIISSDTVCDDGDECSVGDHCSQGQCISFDFVVCTPLDQCHEGGVCDSVTGQCSNPPIADETSCTSSTTCSPNSKCQHGECIAVNQCGDGCIMLGVEECDDENEDNSDDCSNDCHITYCGDGLLHANDVEQCDDGNNVDGDGCSAECVWEPFAITSFTAEVVESVYVTQNTRRLSIAVSYEPSDIHLSSLTVTITTINNIQSKSNCEMTWLEPSQPLPLFTCDVAVTSVADPTVQFVVVGEAKNTETGPSIIDSSQVITFETPTTCGNAVVEGHEECDDGNTINDDQCTNDCHLPRCGDGIVQTPYEQCDDGNRLDHDCCSSLCQTECTRGREFWVRSPVKQRSSHFDEMCDVDDVHCEDLCGLLAFDNVCTMQACTSTCMQTSKVKPWRRLMPLSARHTFNLCIQLREEMEILFLNVISGACISDKLRSVISTINYDEKCYMENKIARANSPLLRMDCDSFNVRDVLHVVQEYNEGRANDGPPLCASNEIHCDKLSHFNMVAFINRLLVKNGKGQNLQLQKEIMKRNEHFTTEN